MSAYTVKLRDGIPDLVLRELNRVAAVTKALDASIQALGGGQTQTGGDIQVSQNAEGGLTTGKQINTRPADAAGAPDTSIRWLRGPWLLGADGNVPADVVIRPPKLTSNQDNYAPLGMDTCVGLELTSDVDRTITGLRSAAVSRRILYIVNANASGGGNLIFAHANAGSIAANQFSIGSGNDTLSLPPGRAIWFVYDVVASVWRLFALPAIPSANLPLSIQPTSVVVLPHGRQWFAFRVGSVPSGGTPAVLGIGCSNPVVDGTAVDNSTANYSYGKFTSTVSAGIRWSGQSNQAVRRDQTPILRIRIKTHTTLTHTNLWIGLSDTEYTTLASLANTNAIVIRFIDGTDAGWVGATCDSGAVVSTIPMGSIATGTEYALQIRASGTSVYFSTDGGVTEYALSTHLPLATFALNAWFARAHSPLGDNIGMNISHGMIEYGASNSGLY